MNDQAAVVERDAAQRVSTLAPAARGRPDRRIEFTIRRGWCKGCRLCSTFCPTEAIEPDDEGHPDIFHPERCIACQWCVIHCPDLAITVDVFSLEES